MLVPFYTPLALLAFILGPDNQGVFSSPPTHNPPFPRHTAVTGLNVFFRSFFFQPLIHHEDEISRFEVIPPPSHLLFLVVPRARIRFSPPCHCGAVPTTLFFTVPLSILTVHVCILSPLSVFFF